MVPDQRPLLRSPTATREKPRDFQHRAIEQVISATSYDHEEIGCTFEVIFQKRVRVFHQGFKHEKTDHYCFRVFEDPMKHEAQLFELTSPSKEN